MVKLETGLLECHFILQIRQKVVYDKKLKPSSFTTFGVKLLLEN